MKIGVYGGSFNPPHLGHVRAAQACKQALGLDRVLVIPASIPPHKQLTSSSASPEERLALTRLAFENLPGFEVLNLEIRREGKSYTVDTIRELKAQYAHDELFLMMGTDMFLSFQDWYSPQEIARCAQLVCFSRYDADAENRAALQKQADTLEKLYGQRPVLLTNDCFDISSTEARRLLVFGIAEPYLPQAVLRRIEAQRLYGAGRDYRGLPFDELKTVSLSLHKKTRAAHAVGVCETARQMARQFGADEALAARAGILHDVTKALTGAQQLLLAEKYEVRLTDFERQNRQLLHAKTGAAIARTLFGECEAVCSAITYHTTGKTDMTTLEKIIYLADMIEPNRTYPGVDTIRAAAEESLDGGVLLALERTICYLQEEGFAVCEDSVRAPGFRTQSTNTKSPPAADVWSSPWTATKRTGRWSKRVGARTCRQRADSSPLQKKRSRPTARKTPA